MQYHHTKTEEIIASIDMTPDDMIRLIKILDDYTGDDYKWFASNSAKTLREAVQKVAKCMIREGEYIKESTNV